MHERLARLEANVETLTQRVSENRETLKNMDTLLDKLAGDIRDAKTALRVGMWLWGIMGAVGGYALHFWQLVTGK